MNLNGAEYFYVRNLQNDIIALLDANGDVKVEYTYDSWGKLTSSTDNSGSVSLATKNPYRYRGYRYDVETELYYLQSRYYSPELGRFMSADDTSVLLMTQGDLLGANLFAYCYNNPIMLSDPSGYIPGSPLAIALSVLFGIIGGAIGYYIAQKNHLNWWQTGLLMGAIAVGGAIIGYLIGEALATSISGFLVSRGLAATTPLWILNILGFGNASYLFGGRLATSAQQFFGFCRQFLEATKQQLSLQQIKDLLYVANKFGLKIEISASSLTGEGAWGPHIHFLLGNARIHIAVAKTAIEYLRRLIN
jgi:RHS repeat-associated protein